MNNILELIVIGCSLLQLLLMKLAICAAVTATILNALKQMDVRISTPQASLSILEQLAGQNLEPEPTSTGRRLVDCSDYGPGVTFDLSAFDETSKIYDGTQVTTNFIAIDNTAGACGPVSFTLSYSPASTTANLISLVAPTSTFVVFKQSSDANDVKKYRVEINAFFLLFQSIYVDYASGNFSYLNPSCQAATLTAIPHPTFTTSVGVAKAQYGASWYDSISGSTAQRYCGSFTADRTVSSGPSGSRAQVSHSSNQVDNYLYVYPKNDPEDVGTYVMHFKVCLELYPTVCTEFDSTFTVTGCVITIADQLKVVMKDQILLYDQYYDLRTTTNWNYALGLYLSGTKVCRFSGATGWTISQGPQILGTSASTFLTIDATTGIYSIAPGQSMASWGTYTIQISSVTLNGVPYDQTQLVAPSFFKLYVHRGCYGLIVTPALVTDVSYQLGNPTDFYPTSGAAFEDFTDTLSLSQNDATYCPKSYTVTIDPANVLTTFLLDQTTRKLQLFGDQPVQIGTYNVTVTGFMTQFPTFYTASKNLTLTVLTSCFGTSLIMPVIPPNLSAMSTSVFVSASQNPTYGIFKDTVSVQQGSPTGTEFCGARKYSISSIVGTATTDLDSTELVIDSTTAIIGVNAQSNSKVGTHAVTVTVYLDLYPLVKLNLTPFTITITKCIVTSVQVVQSSNNAPLAAQTYTMSATDSLQYQLKVLLTPACEYVGTGWNVYENISVSYTSAFETIGSTSGLYQVGPIYGTSDAATYTVYINRVNVDSISYRQAQLLSPKTFTLTVINPCQTTVLTAVQPSAITIGVWDPVFSQSFLDFTDSVSTAKGVVDFCPKTYTSTVSTNMSGYTLSSFVIDATAMLLSVQSLAMNQIGTYTVTFTGKVTAYPTITKSTTFTVTVINPCYTTILTSTTNPLLDMETSVLVQSGAVTQTLGPISDSLSTLRYGGVPNCGSYTFTISSVRNTAPVSLSTTELFFAAPTGVINLMTTLSTKVGTHTATVTLGLASYPTVTRQLTFSITIFPCIVTSFTMMSLTTYVYEIASPLASLSLVGSSITTQTPLCNYAVNLLSSGEPSAFVNVTPGTTLQYSIYTRNLTLEGTSSVLVSATLNNYILGSLQTVQPSCSGSFDLQAVDPCRLTKISIVPGGIERMAIFPGYSTYSLQNYTFNDTASKKYTLTTDSADYCDEKLISFSLNGTKTDMLNATNTGKIFLNVPSNTTQHGVWQASIVAYMKNFTSIRSNQIIFTLTILKPEVPKIPDQIYLVNSPIIQYPYDPFHVEPASYQIGSSLIESYIFTGVSLPDKLDLNCGCLIKLDNYGWISFDYDSSLMKIFTTLDASAGVYTIVLVQSFSNFPNVFPYSKFKVTINARAASLKGKLKPPYFEPELRPITVNQCSDDPTAKVWSFQLPTIIDPQDSAVSIQVLLDSAFFLYDNPTKTISQIKISDSPANKTIKVLLVDEFNQKSTNQMSIQFLCSVQSVFTFNFTQKKQQDEMLAKQTSKPTASIAKIDQTGLLQIQFDQKMKVPENSGRLKTERVIIDGESQPMLKIEVLPGKQSEMALLHFNWTLIEFQVTQLLIQLDFENKNYVSSHNSAREQIQVTIYGNQLFADSLGNLMSPSTVLSPKYLPQMASAEKMAAAQSQANSAQTFLQVGMLANTVVMPFVAGPLQQLLSSVKQLQIIVHIMLVNVAFPAVTTIFMGIFMNLLTFQFYDFSDFYDKALGLDPNSVGNSPLNNQFFLMGYNARYIVKNFGTLCWTIFFGPVAWALFQILAWLSPKKFEDHKIKWNKRMLFNYWIGLINETYMFLAVCCGLNIFFSFSWGTFGDGFNNIVAIFFGAAIFMFPFFVAIWYIIPKNYKLIEKRNEDFLARYGSAISGLNFKRQEKWVLFYATISIFRKLWLALIVVGLQERTVSSIFQINFQALLMMIVTGYTEPMTKKSAGTMELINEGFVFLITYHLYQFTDFMTNLEMRDLVGQSIVYVTLGNIILNIGVVTGQTVLDVARKLKLRYLGYKQEKAIAQQIARKLTTQGVRNRTRSTRNPTEQKTRQGAQEHQLDQINRKLPQQRNVEFSQRKQTELSGGAAHQQFGENKSMKSALRKETKYPLPGHQANSEIRSRNQNVSQDLVEAKVKKRIFSNKLGEGRNEGRVIPLQDPKQKPFNTPLTNVLSKNPDAEVQVTKSFITRIHKNLVELKEVCRGGQLLHISLNVNSAETHFQTISSKDNRFSIAKKRSELQLLAEFIQLDQPQDTHIWDDIKNGYFGRYLRNYQKRKLESERIINPFSNFLDVGDYGPEQPLEYQIRLYKALKQHELEQMRLNN